MEDSTRFRLQQQGEQERLEPIEPEAPASGDSEPPARASTPFVGDAMRALFESGDVRIARGDETRVISRAHEDALAKLPPQARQPAPPPPTSPAQPPNAPAREPAAPPELPSPFDPTPISTAPPGPRVDVTLWVILALGLFAIASWMLLYAL